MRRLSKIRLHFIRQNSHKKSKNNRFSAMKSQLQISKKPENPKKEIGFFPSPLGVLEIVLKAEKLFSVSLKKKNGFPLNPQKQSLQNLPQTGGKVMQKPAENRLCRMDLKAGAEASNDKNSEFSNKKIIKSPFKESKVMRKLKQEFSGFFKEGGGFSVPLSDRGSAFQKKVWAIARKIPFGETISYSEMARRAGNLKACRAAGSACAKNPFLIVVPCHRVLSKKGVGGYALGLKAKKLLLKIESGAKASCPPCSSPTSHTSFAK